MKLKFKSQDFQTQAVNAVVNKGMPPAEAVSALMGRDPIPRRRSYARADMRPPGATGYHPRFPAAVPVRGAGWSRVTQPFATRFFPREGAVRLACVRRAASVHPEPGSNSPSKSPEGP